MRLRVLGGTCVLAAVVALAGRAGWAQQQAAGFEVASIHPHANGDDPSSTDLLPGGRYRGVNVSVRKLIRQALGVEDNQMLNAPGWVDSEHFDVDARTGGTNQLEPPEFQALLLTLLRERFQFRFHRDSAERSVYLLEQVKNGKPLLKEHTGTAQQAMSNSSDGKNSHMQATAISIHDLCALLTRFTGKPVEDRTGLTGSYDVTLLWSNDDAPGAADPSIFGAVQQQLGLRLTGGKAQVETIVIDHIERPSDN